MTKPESRRRTALWISGFFRNYGLGIRNFLFHPVKTLLKNLPAFQAFDFVHHAAIDLGFLRVLRRFADFVKNTKVAGERIAREFVSSQFIDRKSTRLNSS